MTLDEKLSMLHGALDPEPSVGLSSAGYVSGVPRLGIPPLRMADGPAGVRTNQPATALPAPVALSATFDPGLARSYGQVLGLEGRARNQDVLLAPMVNLIRVPQAGRAFETLGEDPLLIARIVAEEVRGIQGAGLIATVKHYAANNQEDNRHMVSANVNEQTLHEIYLPGFESAVKAGAGAVMCAYNKVNGTCSCNNSELLTDILRNQWGFTGWVMTDWFAEHDLSALQAGLDMEMPGTSFGGNQGRPVYFGDPLREAVNADEIPVSYIDQALRRILLQMDRVGLLDGSVSTRPTIDIEADARVAKDIAIAGAVLLRNENNTLPLQHDDLESLVVIGPTAKIPLIGGGGSARVAPFRAESPLDALIRRAGSESHIIYVKGIDLDGVVVPGSVLSPPDDPSTQGLMRTASDGTTQIDPQVDYTGSNALEGSGTYKWTGTLTVPIAGEYELKVQTSGGGGSELLLDGVEIMSLREFFGGVSLIPTAEGLENRSATVHLEAGAHAITLTVGPRRWGPPSTSLQIRLAWVMPEWRQAKIDAAVAAARSAKAVVVFGYAEGTEGVDRTSLALSGNQDALIAAVAGANRNNTVVLNTGAAVLMPWVEQTSAVLEMWFPGQEGADATAALLLGDANPGGKLPETFPRSEADMPVNTPERYPGVNDQEAYSEGIFVGYRWYDAQGIEPLFPFGHGLSYTQFEYSKLNIQPKGDGFDISFLVRNVGPMQGAEVSQIYLGPPSAPPAPMAQKKLVGFQRVVLDQGHSEQVTVHVGARELSYWSTEQHGWTVAVGSRPVYIGSSSRDIRLQGTTKSGN